VNEESTEEKRNDESETWHREEVEGNGEGEENAVL